MKQLLLIILLFSTNGILSQVTQEWVQRYDGPAGSFDIARQMILNQDGSVLVFGNSVGVTTLADMTIIKYSASGVEEWVSRYDYENRSDNITSAGMDMQGNIYITGFVTNSSKVSNLVLLKFDPAGNFLWIKTFDSTAFTQSYGESLTIAQDGNIYIAGTARNLSSNNDYITLKYTPSGQRLWLRVFNGTENGEDNALSIVSDDSNNVFITGTSKGSEPSTDIVTLKYDPSGNLVFNRAYNGISNNDDRPTSLIVDNNYNLLISGVTFTQFGSFDYVTLKYDRFGTLLWDKTYNGTGNSLDYSYQIITDRDNNVYVTGSSRNTSIIGSEDVVTIKYDSLGDLKWTNRFDGQAGGSDIGYCLAVDSNLNVYIGSAIDQGNVLLNFGTIKLDPFGDLKWFQTYTFHSAPEDFPYAIAVDTSDNVFISGISFGGSTDYDITTVKYSQSVGIIPISNNSPSEFRLFQNYPNPFNPSTKIKFDIAVADFVTVKIYDAGGKKVAGLVADFLNPGSYEYLFDASLLASGVYFCTLNSGDHTKINKMLLIR